jgi:hypothetical protein
MSEIRDKDLRSALDRITFTAEDLHPCNWLPLSVAFRYARAQGVQISQDAFNYQAKKSGARLAYSWIWMVRLNWLLGFIGDRRVRQE